ncbi:MAG: NAD(+)/NADH kinase [Oscillospiraceae bacterium]|jgi:NAD+ kinase|nr:NAD(+)/NADH kinase [Oscillospiraceae bacterium]
MNFLIIHNEQNEKACRLKVKAQEVILQNGGTLTDKLDNCDFVISVGGDGTIIKAGKLASSAGKPLLGINAGRVGFSAELEECEIENIAKLLSGDYHIEDRMLLDVCVQTSTQTHCFLAVNDAVISRGNLSRMIDLEVYLNEQPMVSYRADGIVIASPTGSTAYSLSAGGPIIHPQMSCIVMSPICSHSLISRAAVLGENSVLSICADSNLQDEQSYLTIDGQESLGLSATDRVIIKKADKTLKLAAIKERNFFKHVFEKLVQR